MAKRKATTDIHPDALYGSPAKSRSTMETQIPITSTSLGITCTPLLEKYDSKGSGSPSIGSKPCDDLGTTKIAEALTPSTSKDCLPIQHSTAQITSKTESGPLSTEVPSEEYNSKTARSQHFLEKIADLNRSFANWINICVKNDPTALLTRVFIDHQRQVEALFNNEIHNTKGEDNHLVLRAQANVVKLLKYEEENKDSSSSDDDDDDENSIGSEEDKTSHTYGISATEASQVNKTPSLFSHQNTDTLSVIDPLHNNDVLNGSEPVRLLSQSMNKVDGTINTLEPNTVAAVVDKPMNFGAFSFASACSEAAAKAAAAKEQESEEANDDNPPKVVFTPVQEEGAIYTKRCKIFFKKEKEEGYEDRGVGNLFVKPVPATNRHQLIVRADNSLGNLLVNAILSPDIPIKKMGQKDVMMVMIPTPGSGIRVVMIRVKDGVDEVVEMLTKYSTV